jgi:hypothetical protein
MKKGENLCFQSANHKKGQQTNRRTFSELKEHNLDRKNLRTTKCQFAKIQGSIF